MIESITRSPDQKVGLVGIVHLLVSDFENLTDAYMYTEHSEFEIHQIRQDWDVQIWKYREPGAESYDATLDKICGGPSGIAKENNLPK